MHCWLADSLRRFYPQSVEEVRNELDIQALRGEQISFQVVCRTEDVPVEVTAEVVVPDNIEASVRRVGYVPLPHFSTDTPGSELEGLAYGPGLVPDPLYPESTISAGPWETNSFWITVNVGTDASPGMHEIVTTVSGCEEAPGRLTVHLLVHEAILPARHGFPVTHWFYLDAIIEWYQLELADEELWQLLRAYFRDLVQHGQDVLYVPLFTPPLEGDKRPTQLLHVEEVGEGRFSFDWSLVKRWIDLARSEGIRYFEWSHLFSQWGAQFGLKVYRAHGEDEHLLWNPETLATSDTYRRFLAQFLPSFERFLREEGLIEQSFFHVSDEPHGAEHLANYRQAREMLRELAPWMKVMDALSDAAFAREGLIDVPVLLLPEVPTFLDEGFAAWAYFCCVPRGYYLNRMFDTPLIKIRMTGWICYRMAVRGFLHWGYNFWYESRTRRLIDPFTQADGGQWPSWASGDPFVVYPGPDGPIASIRWEVFGESLQDYALLQTAGIEADDPLLVGIKDFADFPRDPSWITEARRAAMARLSP